MKMTQAPAPSASGDVPGGEPEPSERQTVLVVGDLLPHALPDTASAWVTRAHMTQITEKLLAETRPQLVLSPLVGPGYDCFDIAERLSAAGYGGRYRAVVDTLPDPSVVRREVAAQFPGLDFDLVVMRPPGGGPAAA